MQTFRELSGALANGPRELAIVQGPCVAGGVPATVPVPPPRLKDFDVRKTLCVDGVTTSHSILVADTWWRRAVGLLATPSLVDPCGLWIEPCNSVHTMGMRYAIDVLFLDAGGRVLKVVPALKPLRAAGCRGARSTLELRAGLAAELQLAEGMRLSWVPATP